MIAALIHGTLLRDPVERATSKGKPYTTAQMRVPAGEETLFVGIAAFDAVPAARLAQMRQGGTVAVAGTLEATSWQDKDGNERSGWRLTAAEVLSVHQARKRREAGYE